MSAVPPASAAQPLSQEATFRQLEHHYRSQPPSPKLLSFRAEGPSGLPTSGSGGTDPPDGEDRIDPVTPTRPRHHCRTAAHRGPRGWARPCDKPPRRRSRRLSAPPQAGRLQTAATPGSYQPPDSGIGACREPAEAPAHSPPAEQARFRRPSRERARKTRGHGGGRGYAGRGGAAAFREARSKSWNPRSLAAGVRSGAGGKPLALLSRDRGQGPSGCLAHGFL